MRGLLQFFGRFRAQPPNLARGALGERAARRRLEAQGLRLLEANFKSKRGEIDLIMRDRDCLVFIEVKTRRPDPRRRPASAVNGAKRRRLSRAAMDYLKRLEKPPVKFRFDVIEVLMGPDNIVVEIRHLPNTFALVRSLRYG